MTWYTVRFVYEHERDADGHATFAEAVVLFEAPDSDELIEKAESYWARCQELNPQFKRRNNLTAFTIHGDSPPGEGTEIWCELSQGKVSMDEFVQARYEQFAV
jgi:hypothetical protein